MNEEDKIAWIDEENRFHAIEESIKQTHTYVKCNYKKPGCFCRILVVDCCYYCKIIE